MSVFPIYEEYYEKKAASMHLLDKKYYKEVPIKFLIEIRFPVVKLFTDTEKKHITVKLMRFSLSDHLSSVHICTSNTEREYNEQKIIHL